ncbi:hypothetical protein WH216_05635 [Xanthomonas perforans]|uniref:hypothetical protein n=1 Tax=Xanthomonas TaxID=338 RepID=UPI001E2CC131|nr:hypothetical protein [Xanthomonas vesicatoria]MCC8628530.1 hypothetical protein [Xanthomonas vesicatoria]MDG4483026.1 hypothetical protein [Xanthomonas vesicatoria]
MLSRLIRLLLALTAIAPISVSVAYSYATRAHNMQLAAIAALVCVLLGLISLWIIGKCQTSLERVPVKIEKAKNADKEVIGFFIAYALPLVFKGQASLEIGEWILAAAMLLFVLWSTNSLQVNPVLGLFGFHFYEVETSNKITFLLITRTKITQVGEIQQIVQLSEYGILEAADKNGV